MFPSPMSIYSVSFLAFLATLKQQAAAQVILTRDQAVAAVSAEVGVTAQSLIWCPNEDFGFGVAFAGALPASSQIRPAEVGTLNRPGNVVRLKAPMYLFFHDLHPLAEFSHDVDFIYVDATVLNPSLADGTIVVQRQGWWPEISVNGDPFLPHFGPEQRYSTINPSAANPDGLAIGNLIQPDDRVNPNDVITTADFNAVYRGGPPGLPTANPCAIVASGSPDGHFGNNVDLMKQSFMDRGVTGNRLQSMKNASYAEVEALIENICPDGTNPPNPPCDKIYFYFATHGGNNSLRFRDGSKTAEQICNLLKKLGEKNVPVCIFIQACHSGSLVDDLRSNTKFPKGSVIITSADAASSSEASACRDEDGDALFPGFTRLSYFTCAVILCWNDSDADSDGDGKVSWTEAVNWACSDDAPPIRRRGPGGALVEEDPKAANPTLNGRPSKYQRWTGPASGRKYFDCCQDLDKDGQYDQKEWWVDRECDGIWDAIYRNIDNDEDGKHERRFCFQDTNGDGIPDVRLEHIDKNDDGIIDRTERSTWNGSDWVLANVAPLRQVGGINALPANGPQNGGAPTTLFTVDSFFDVAYTIVIGSDVREVQPVSPNQINIIPEGFRAGPQDIMIIDWSPSSPTFGITIQPKGYTYDPELELFGTDPQLFPFGLDGPVILHGEPFGQSGQVQFEADFLPVPLPPLPAIPLGPLAMDIPIPPHYFPQAGLYDLRLQLQDGRNRLLEDALIVYPTDFLPPFLLCPPELTKIAGTNGLATLPIDFQATASDDESKVLAVTQNDLGSLPIGDHLIQFQAVDAFGNRTTCESFVEVLPAGLLGDMNCDGVISVSDIGPFVLALTNPAGYMASFP
ncbi:MAG: C13 family peptidase [Phycisphaerae bacterium]